jgi:hypothetical protein
VKKKPLVAMRRVNPTYFDPQKYARLWWSSWDDPSRAHHELCELTAMVKDTESPEPFTATAWQMSKQTQGAMENYFCWLQMAMPMFPWGNTNLNRILLQNATQNVSATFAFVQKLSQAKNFQDVVKIQTEFMETQMNSFNDQAKVIGEIYANAAKDALKGSS